MPAFLFISVPGALWAQAPPLSPEFQVNTYTTGRQGHPAVAAWDGGFIVVWARGPFNPGIFAQTYDSEGRPAGSEFQVNTGMAVPGQYPSVAADAAGGFVVAWEDASDGQSQGQRFDSNGTRVGSQFALTGTHPRVAADAAGDFVVLLTQGSYIQLVGQRFDSSGASVGSQFVVASSTTETSYYVTDTYYPQSAAVTMSSAGDFVVVWDVGVSIHMQGGRPQNYPDLATDIRGQRYHRSGVKLGPTFFVANDVDPVPSVAEDKPGNFVIVWNSGAHIAGQRFDGAGAKVGPSISISTATVGYPSVAIDGAGNFLVVWGHDYVGTSGALFDRQGNRLNGEFPINSNTTEYPGQPWVASDGHGFVVTWESRYGDGSGFGVFGRRQNLLADALTADSGPATGTVSDRNGVLEPGETVFVAPAWKNATDAPITVTGGTAIVPCALGTACVTP